MLRAPLLHLIIILVPMLLEQDLQATGLQAYIPVKSRQAEDIWDQARRLRARPKGPSHLWSACAPTPRPPADPGWPCGSPPAQPAFLVRSKEPTECAGKPPSARRGQPGHCPPAPRPPTDRSPPKRSSSGGRPPARLSPPRPTILLAGSGAHRHREGREDDPASDHRPAGQKLLSGPRCSPV